MPRLQPLAPLLRPLAHHRPSACRPHFRFSTAPRLLAEEPSLPPNATSSAPATPQAAHRAADLAAAEAVTEADSAQPPEPKPTLLSTHSDPAPADTNASTTTSQTNPSLKEAQRDADLAIALALSESARAKSTKPSPTTLPQRPQSAFQARKFKPETRTQKALRLAQAAKTPPTTSQTTISLPPPRYHVARSATKNLPVYTDYKRGGNLQLTQIRKITGDQSALRDELRVYLNKRSEEVSINATTGHVVVKGHCKGEVERFLRQRGM